MIKRILFFVMVCLLVPQVVAQTEQITNDDDYKNADFYKASDPQTWDWNKVDFNNPAIYQNQKLYFTPVFSQNFHRVPPHLYGMVQFYKLNYNLLDYTPVPDQFYQHP